MSFLIILIPQCYPPTFLLIKRGGDRSYTLFCDHWSTRPETHSLASSEHCFPLKFVLFWKVGTDGRRTCAKTNYHVCGSAEWINLKSSYSAENKGYRNTKISSMHKKLLVFRRLQDFSWEKLRMRNIHTVLRKSRGFFAKERVLIHSADPSLVSHLLSACPYVHPHFSKFSKIKFITNWK